MDHVVRRAITLGLSPPEAIQTVTLKPATYSGLEQEIGRRVPGRFADVVLLDDPRALVSKKVRDVPRSVADRSANASFGDKKIEGAAAARPCDAPRCAIGLTISSDTFKIAALNPARRECA